MPRSNETSRNSDISQNSSKVIHSRFYNPLPQSEEPTGRPRPYQASLTPAPSPLRPHCHAKNRLKMWLPLNSNVSRANLFSPENLERVKFLIAGAWSDNTHEVYGSGLLVYHVWCDLVKIPETNRAPASCDTILHFISALAGGYAGDAISNYVAAVRAWHILHDLPWNMSPEPYVNALKAANLATPSSSRRKQRPPCLTEHIKLLGTSLDLSNPLHAAVWSCATALFYGMARSGELTVPKLNTFNPNLHPTVDNIRQDVDPNNLKVTAIHLPSTKARRREGKTTGEDIFWGKQQAETDADNALQNHIKVNDPRPGEHIFSHTHGNNRRPLTKQILMRTINTALAPHGIYLHGHSFRIGGTLERLLKGVPFDVVKSKGRWAGDSFKKYLRKNTEIMAPYVQQDPEAHTRLTRWQLAPVPPARA